MARVTTTRATTGWGSVAWARQQCDNRTGLSSHARRSSRGAFPLGGDAPVSVVARKIIAFVAGFDGKPLYALERLEGMRRGLFSDQALSIWFGFAFVEAVVRKDHDRGFPSKPATNQGCFCRTVIGIGSASLFAQEASVR